MPIHDWTRVRAGTFHHFHQCWIAALGDALNTGRLPPGYFALATPPKTRARSESDAANYARRADRLIVRRNERNAVAVIEVVSPGNKGSRRAVRNFTRKAVALLRAGIHLLVVDLFPPNARNPQGIHKAVWDRIQKEPFTSPPGKPLTLAAYSAGVTMTAFVEPIGVRDVLVDMPVFLAPDGYVPCPLVATYQTAWSVFPGALKGQLEDIPPAQT
jgi:hypothetical protein